MSHLLKERPAAAKIPDLSIFTDDALRALAREIDELDGLSNIPANWLSVEGFLRLDTDRGEEKIARYRELLQKYPWYQAPELLERAVAVNSMLSTMGQILGEPSTGNREANAAYVGSSTRRTQSSSDLIRAEFQRRRGRVMHEGR